MKPIAGLRLCGAAAALMMAGWAGAAQAPLAALRGVELGQWELRERASDDEPRRICLSHASQLLQLRHFNQSCKRFVVSDSARAATVTYDCAGGGSGRSDVRVETPRLVQIRSQGIAGGAPFSYDVEGRHVGACH